MSEDPVARRAARSARLEARDVRALTVALRKRLDALEAAFDASLNESGRAD